jgi:formylglycine-generating enzyme required for sulfatase activity
MTISPEPRIRIFTCDNGIRHLDTIRATLEALDVAVIVMADGAEPPPKADKAIAIWDGAHSPNFPDWFREVAFWDKRSTELYLCRMSGEKVETFTTEPFESIYNFDERLSLRDWLVRSVLQLQEDEELEISITSQNDALNYYRSRLTDHLSENRHHSGLHAVQKKPVVETYIPLTLFRDDGAELSASEENYREIVSRGGRRFVLGLPGTGKSTVCSLVAYFAANGQSEDRTNYFPVLLRAKNIVELGYDSLIASIRLMIKRVVGRKGKLISDLILEDDELPDAQTVLFIDGLDELNEDERSKLRQQLNSFDLEHLDSAIIISSRPNAYERGKWEEYEPLRIRPLTLSEAISYVEEHGVEDNAAALMELIQNSEQIQELASVPFMLTLMANYAGEAEDFPRHRAKLISKCIIALVNRRRKIGAVVLDDDSIIDCLAYVSNRLFRINPTGDHSEAEFLLAVHAFLSERTRAPQVRTSPGEEAEVALNEIIAGTALLQRAGHQIEFVHRTVWEFFVAHFIVSQSSYDVASFSNQVVWEEPIRIACGLMSADFVGDFCAPIWIANPGLALRALSESPHEIDRYVAKGLDAVSTDQIRDIVGDLKDNLLDTVGRFGAERIALDTLKMLLPLSRDAEVYWLGIETLDKIVDRRTEARELLTSVLSLEQAEQRFLELAESLEFISISGGEFWMGSPPEIGSVDQIPRHKVSVSSLQFGSVTLRNKDVRGLPFDIGMDDPSRSPSPEHPIIRVTWYEAQIAAIWFGCRLPTEAEWEFCCRAGGSDDDYLYSEDKVSDYAWHSGNSSNQTHVGGQKAPNSLGIFDMLGNVREWCSDWFQEDLYALRADVDTVDPKGPIDGKNKVLRGGCFDYNLANLYPSNRHSHLPSTRGFQNGFRFVVGFPDLVESILLTETSKQQEN